MTEMRQDIRLPYVIDSAPDAARQLASLLSRVVDFELPGLGIVHGEDGGKTHLEAHATHQELVLEAASLMNPSIATKGAFTQIGSLVFREATRMHTDLACHLEPAEGLEMELRLHTTDAGNGATVALVNTAPGIASPGGDTEVYSAYGHPTYVAAGLGYDVSGRLVEPADLLQRIEEGSYDPLVVEANVYHFMQRGLDSVLFRSMTGTGPVTAHGFEPFDAATPRRVAVSDLTVHSY